MGSLFGGNKQPAPSKFQQDAETRQTKELDKLDRQEAQRMNAAKRKRRGRASLISGSETGLKDTLG